MARKFRLISAVVSCLVLSLLFGSTVLADYGPDEGTIRGAAFVDSNKNGQMDEGEQGLGWVYFTISNGSYSHTYFSQWQTVDEAGNTHVTGTFGPTPLPKGGWNVKLHVPEGYVATTPIEQVVYVPGAEGGHVAYVYMGLYPTKGTSSGGALPASGAGSNTAMVGALVALAAGVVIAGGLGAIERRRA